MTRTLPTIFVALFAAQSVMAQSRQAPASPPPEPNYPVVRVGVVSFLQYDAELENRDDFNVFDVTRAYLNINGQLSRNVRFRVTPDIRRVTDGSLAGSLTLRLKYGFVELANLTPRSWLRFGLHQTPWLDFEESINRYRVQGTMFAEREALIPGSGDFGVGYFMPLPGGFGEVQAGLYNGEGFAQTDANKYKSVQGRLTVRPFPNAGVATGLRLSGFYNWGWYGANRPRRLGILMASFEHRNVVATIQGLTATENPALLPRDTDRKGTSAFLEVREGPAGWAGLVRFDAFDPDDALVGNRQQRIIAGGAYWWTWPAARIGLVGTNEQVHYDAPTRLDENRLLVQTHVEF